MILVDIDEVTLTFAVSHYPREVLKYLAGKECYTVKEKARRMLTEYEKHRDNILYSSVMDIVVRASKEAFYEEEVILRYFVRKC